MNKAGCVRTSDISLALYVVASSETLQFSGPSPQSKDGPRQWERCIPLNPVHNWELVLNILTFPFHHLRLTNSEVLCVIFVIEIEVRYHPIIYRRGKSRRARNGLEHSNGSYMNLRALVGGRACYLSVCKAPTPLSQGFQQRLLPAEYWWLRRSGRKADIRSPLGRILRGLDSASPHPGPRGWRVEPVSSLKPPSVGDPPLQRSCQLHLSSINNQLLCRKKPTISETL
jgi:hypothetical protein